MRGKKREDYMGTGSQFYQYKYQVRMMFGDYPDSEETSEDYFAIIYFFFAMFMGSFVLANLGIAIMSGAYNFTMDPENL